MARIVNIKFRDGSVKVFKESSRGGGSCTMFVRTEPGWVAFTDEWENKTSWPADLVAEVESIG